MTQAPAKNRIEIVHCLRGLAALAVCWFHFTHGHPAFLTSGLLMQSGTWGWLGVEVFFVISGFILPYALYSSGYQLSFTTYRLFLAKRLVRLEPPYLATIVLAIVLALVSEHIPGYRGAPFHLDPWRVAAHLGYLCSFLKYEWLNPVFWTLALEFQFYLAVGLIFPLLTSAHRATRLTAQCSLVALSLIPSSDSLIFHYLFLFLIGIVTFQVRMKVSSRTEAIILLIICGIGASWRLGITIAAVGICTSCLILMVRWQNKILHFLGTLSYSLYLVHVPVGGRVINIGERVGGGTLTHLAFLAGAMLATLLAAWLMYRLIEKPSQAYAGRISFGRAAKTAPPVAIGTAVSG